MSPASALIVLTVLPLAEPAREPDLSCEVSGHYTGNAISPVFRLKIGPPRNPRWTYSTSDDMFGTLKAPRAVEYQGSYEIDGDLAVFTGEPAGDKTRAVRFGLNFGFPGGEVTFDRFFPDARGGFSYRRKWFRPRGGGWRPAEERRLTLSLPTEEPAETLEVACKGQRLRWDAEGKRAEEPVDLRLRYKRSQADWYVLEKPAGRKGEWLPGELILQREKGKVVSLSWSNRYVGDLRGFHPGYAELADAP
jgi:hypothetical protein